MKLIDIDEPFVEKLIQASVMIASELQSEQSQKLYALSLAMRDTLFGGSAKPELRLSFATIKDGIVELLPQLRLQSKQNPEIMDLLKSFELEVEST